MGSFIETGARYFNMDLMPYDASYGPWNSFDEYLETIVGVFDDEEKRYALENLPSGITIAIKSGETIVEYWVKTTGSGFVKKESKNTERVDDFETAILLATNDNIGSIYNIINESIVDGVKYQPGMYIVTGDGKLNNISRNFGSEIDELKKIINGDGENKGLVDKDSTNFVLSTDGESDDDFIEVSGVTVGGLKSGDKISKNTTLEDLLKKILQKELIPGTTTKKPTVTLSGVTGGIYEIGSTVTGTLSATFNDGKLPSYSKNSITEEQIDAGCSKLTTTYYGGVSVNTTLSNTSVSVSVDKIGTIATYKASITYGASTNIPTTSFGNYVETPAIISAGTATSSIITIKGDYKVWYSFEEDNINPDYTLGEDTYLTDANFNAIKNNETWLGTIPKVLKESGIEITDNKKLYVLVPDGYGVTIANNAVTALTNKGPKYEYTNGTVTTTYRVWYVLNKDIYKDLKIVKL